MHKEFLMGNEAIAMGAIAAGVNLACGYPGTPSSEVLETIAKRRGESLYVEWSVNEKAAMEIAAGAAYSGARALVTMKQVGLNVASDPLMCLEYIGVKGGLVVLVADDPGPVSSQTEQDTRHFADFSKIPCFDPSSAQEAYEMVQEAFDLSEKYSTPVLFRSTTRVSHGYASIEVKDENEYKSVVPEGFIKDTGRWVIFPRLANINHAKIEKRNEKLSDIFSDYDRNLVLPADKTHENRRMGIASGGISFAYVMEAVKKLGKLRLFKVSTPFPFPEKKALEFLDGLDEVLCIEELDPVIERSLIFICGKYNLNTKIYGKLTHHVSNCGENSVDSVFGCIASFLRVEEAPLKPKQNPPRLPARPPVLCAGCPHRASFYAVKKAMKGKKTIFCGDIGCYTLGNAMPLDMVDTCLCMGAGLGIAQGVEHIEPDTACFAFVGDSTFFASAITGAINAVYNRTNMTLIVLDNSTTAMTGHQPHPGTGKTLMGQDFDRINMEAVLSSIGLVSVETVNPFEHEKAVKCVRRAAALKGVKAIIFRYPCIALIPPSKKRPLSVKESSCTFCGRCIKEIGCPALARKDGKVSIDETQCTGCSLCARICPSGAIS